jgi:hypothetical protein
MDSRHSEFTHRLTADFQYAHCDFHNYFADIHAYRDLKKNNSMRPQLPCEPRPMDTATLSPPLCAILKNNSMRPHLPCRSLSPSAQTWLGP